MFQRDWNHQPDYVGWYPWNLLWWCNTLIWCGSTLRAKSVVVFKFFFRHCCWVWCWWTQISTRLMMMKNKENDEHGPLSLMMYHYLPIENGEQSFHVRKCLVWHSMFAVFPVFPGCSVQDAWDPGTNHACLGSHHAHATQFDTTGSIPTTTRVQGKKSSTSRLTTGGSSEMMGDGLKMCVEHLKNY